MLKKILSLVVSFLVVFQCIPNVFAHSNCDIDDNIDINSLESQIIEEIIDKREENIKYFKLKDEQILKVEYPIAVHKKNDEDQWIDIYGKERGNLINFSQNSDSEKLVQIQREQYEISWNFENANKVEILNIDTNHKAYKNIYNNVDLDYTISKNKLKENLVLTSNSAQQEFIVNYNLKGLIANQINNKTIDLINANGKCVYTISVPKMFDSNQKNCDNLTIEIISNKNDQLKIKINCDKDWLNEEERVYPVFVDPDYTDESFEYIAPLNAKCQELTFRTNWRRKDTNKSIFLNLTGSDFTGLGVVKIQIFGKNSNGEENCTYETQCYFLEEGKKYELYNKVYENGYSEVQLRFVCLPGNVIRGSWSPDYQYDPNAFTIGSWGSKSISKKKNSANEPFNLTIKPDRHCWVSFKTKATNSSVYLALEGHGEKVNVEVWGLGGQDFKQNCTYKCQNYTLTLGNRYELYNLVNENKHTGAALRFEGEPEQKIVGLWSPDFNEEYERKYNPGWILIDGSGTERIMGQPRENIYGVPIGPIKNVQSLLDVPQLSQLGEFPTGCESVSATMLLNFYGYKISVRDFIDKYLDKRGVSEHPDPNSAFVGSPYTKNSYGCFAPCIAKAMNKILNGDYAEVIRGKTLKTLSDEYIQKNIPLIVWVTMCMRETRPTTSWTINYTDENARYKKGDRFTWPGNEHCVVLLGFSEQDYFVNDPLQPLGKVRGAYEKSLMEKRFKEQGSQCVTLRKSTSILNIGELLIPNINFPDINALIAYTKEQGKDAHKVLQNYFLTKFPSFGYKKVEVYLPKGYAYSKTGKGYIDLMLVKNMIAEIYELKTFFHHVYPEKLRFSALGKNQLSSYINAMQYNEELKHEYNYTKVVKGTTFDPNELVLDSSKYTGKCIKYKTYYQENDQGMIYWHYVKRKNDKIKLVQEDRIAIQAFEYIKSHLNEFKLLLDDALANKKDSLVVGGTVVSITALIALISLHPELVVMCCLI